MADVGTVRADRCDILTLVLKGRWYDMIASGVKKEEYRTSKNVCAMIDRWVGRADINSRLKVVRFCRGYQANRPTMTYLSYAVDARDRSEHPDWGEPTESHYAIQLDKEVKLV